MGSRTEGGLVTWESGGDGWSGAHEVRGLVDRRQIVDARDRRLASRQQREVGSELGRHTEGKCWRVMREQSGTERVELVDVDWGRWQWMSCWWADQLSETRCGVSSWEVLTC